jgi:type IV pilus assembly protein PilN
MIRINLLPAAKRGAAVTTGSSQLWGVAYLLGLFAWGVLLFFFYMSANSKLEEQRAANTALEQEIDQAKQKSANIGDVEAKLAKSRQLEEVVGKLQTARQGPTRVLMELSHLLSESGGPSVSAEKLDALRRDNPLAGFNPGWDVRRLWLTAFTEQARACAIRGFGKTNEDVAEFLRRLNLSNLFEKVTLQATSSAIDPTSSTAVVSFELSCQVRY